MISGDYGLPSVCGGDSGGPVYGTFNGIYKLQQRHRARRRELAGLKADYLTAASTETLARDTLMREERLWEHRVTPEADLQAARAGVAAAEASRKAAENKLHAVGVSDGALLDIFPNLSRFDASQRDLGFMV